MPDDGLEILVAGRDAPGDRFRAWVGTPTSPGWTPASHLFGAGLDATLAAVRDGVGADSDAVAASLLLEGYAQRVVPSAIASRVLTGRSVATDPDSVHVRLDAGRAREVAFTDAPGDSVVAGLVPVVEVLHRRTRAGHRVLSGAIAHAVTVAFLHLSWPAPDHARHLDDARRVLADAGLTDLVRVEAVPVDGEPWLYADRRTCCLAFRTARNRARGPSYCATCPVLPEDERRRSFTDAVAAFVRRRAET
ncbi:ferric iron reductase protein FhuF [Actinomycetospora succinea]|uniref:Ferric iron reductase protein FhuF n=1 Tax=Actinomycetospora succinea TaxID=663603 RepID=A0A4R6UN47_9PSEU|nr:hypothetical protein [Actinomycetospora succinea]TDQ47019.1 ferric iron reductase protein FhuF [Actinomycetospora succinea]